MEANQSISAKHIKTKLNNTHLNFQLQFGFLSLILLMKCYETSLTVVNITRCDTKKITVYS